MLQIVCVRWHESVETGITIYMVNCMPGIVMFRVRARVPLRACCERRHVSPGWPARATSVKTCLYLVFVFVSDCCLGWLGAGVSGHKQKTYCRFQRHTWPLQPPLYSRAPPPPVVQLFALRPPPHSSSSA